MTNFARYNINIILLLGLTLLAENAWSQSFPGCDDVQSSEFTMEYLVSLDNDNSLIEPLKMAFDMDAQGAVDIYFVERLGSVKYFNAADGSVKKIGDVSPATGNEDGLVGIALHPEFKTNNWMFLFYSKDEHFRVSRFTLDPTSKDLDLDSEEIVLAIPSGRGRWHSSGAMNFDAYGDLWINVGDNEAEERGPANTADLRGGILRIHPEDDGTYTIPEGNLWEFASEWFTDNGNSAVGDLYLDESRASQEIYFMGTRNAYTQTLDPVRRWVTYGDCGPDYASGSATQEADMSEEHTVVTEPGFGGWPYFTGTMYRQPNRAGSYDEPDETFWGDQISMTAPVNQNSTIEGIPELLPMKGATHLYPHSCAMTGPIYRYDGALDSDVKFPPHYNRTWFVTDFNQNNIWAVTLDDAGDQVGNKVEVFAQHDIRKVLDMQMGPDGALYVNNYSCNAWRQANECTGISKISYNGSCRPTDLLPERAGCKDPGFAEYDEGAEYSNPRACVTPVSVGYLPAKELGLEFLNGSVRMNRAGSYTIRVMDVKGKLLQTMEFTGPGTTAIPSYRGVMVLEVKTDAGFAVQKLTPAGSL